MTERHFAVRIHTHASATLYLTLTGENLRERAEALGKPVAELTREDLAEYVEEKAYARGTPDVCANCSGWGNPTMSLELGDDWETDEDQLDAAGNVVFPAVEEVDDVRRGSRF